MIIHKNYFVSKGGKDLWFMGKQDQESRDYSIRLANFRVM